MRTPNFVLATALTAAVSMSANATNYPENPNPQPKPTTTVTTNPKAEAGAQAAAQAAAQAGAQAGAHASQQTELTAQQKQELNSQQNLNNQNAAIGGGASMTGGGATLNSTGPSVNIGGDKYNSFGFTATQGVNTAVMAAANQCNEINNKGVAFNLAIVMDVLGFSGGKGEHKVADERCLAGINALGRLMQNDEFKFRTAFLKQQLDHEKFVLVMNHAVDRVFRNGGNGAVNPSQNNGATQIEHAAMWLAAADDVQIIRTGMTAAVEAKKMLGNPNATPENIYSMALSATGDDVYAGKSHAQRMETLRNAYKAAETTVEIDGKKEVKREPVTILDIVSQNSYNDFRAKAAKDMNFITEMQEIRIPVLKSGETTMTIGDRKNDDDVADDRREEAKAAREEAKEAKKKAKEAEKQAPAAEEKPAVDDKTGYNFLPVNYTFG